jgi:hypothetical protein
MAIEWKDGENTVITVLVTRLATLEVQVKELEEDKAAKTLKKEDLVRKLRTVNNPMSNNKTNENDSLANILKRKNKMNEIQINILNFVGNEQNQGHRKEINVMLFGVSALKAGNIDLKVKEEK